MIFARVAPESNWSFLNFGASDNTGLTHNWKNSNIVKTLFGLFIFSFHMVSQIISYYFFTAQKYLSNQSWLNDNLNDQNILTLSFYVLLIFKNNKLKNENLKITILSVEPGLSLAKSEMFYLRMIFFLPDFILMKLSLLTRFR